MPTESSKATATPSLAFPLTGLLLGKQQKTFPPRSAPIPIPNMRTAAPDAAKPSQIDHHKPPLLTRTSEKDCKACNGPANFAGKAWVDGAGSDCRRRNGPASAAGKAWVDGAGSDGAAEEQMIFDLEMDGCADFRVGKYREAGLWRA